MQALGSDAVVFENAAAYTERFNLNTRADVLANPEKRSALLALDRTIVRSSAELRKRPPDFVAVLSPHVGLQDKMKTEGNELASTAF